MATKSLLLLLTVGLLLLCHLSCMLATDWTCEDNNACNNSNNNNNNAHPDTANDINNNNNENNNDNKNAFNEQPEQQAQQHERLQHDAQQLTAQYMLKLQQQQQQQHQQSQQAHEQEQQQVHSLKKRHDEEFEPFDFANLWRLQQIKAYYDTPNNNNNNLQQQQLPKRTLVNVNDYEDIDDNNNNAYITRHYQAHNNNNNNNYNSDSVNNNNAHQNRNNKHVRAGTELREKAAAATLAAAAAAAAAAEADGLASRPQDASNDFLLQLSALNEPQHGYKNNNNNNNEEEAQYVYNNNNNNNNNYNNMNGIVSYGSGHPSIDYYGAHHPQQQREREHVASKYHNNDDNDDNAEDVDTMHSITLRAQSNNNADEYFDTLDTFETENLDVELPTEVDDEYDELGEALPYGIQNVRKRKVRGSPIHEHHSRSTTYQSLCPTKRISIPLETTGYEYRPNHYIEVTCAHGYSPSRNYDFNRNKICSEAGFSCIQLNRTIHLIRRNKAAAITDCWESEIRIVPSGCECMWPKHSYGDIVVYHEPQKRYTAEANEVPVADYQPGVGYMQIPRQVATIGLDGRRNQESRVGVGFESYAFN